MWLPLMHPLLGTWPRTQACALTGNRTGNPLVPRPALNPLSHTSQGNINSLPSLCDHPPEATKAITTRSTWDPTLALPGQPAASLIPAGLSLLSSDTGCIDNTGHVIKEIRALFLSREQLKAFHRPTSAILRIPDGSPEEVRSHPWGRRKILRS